MSGLVWITTAPLLFAIQAISGYRQVGHPDGGRTDAEWTALARL
jgi:hypothetical protein